MGYMGLSVYGESDTASDSMSVIVDSMMKALKREHKDNKNNGAYNTDGDVNTCLLIEAGIFNFEGASVYLEDHLDFFRGIRESMEKQIASASKDGLDAEHKQAYKRMTKHLTQFIQKNEEK